MFDNIQNPYDRITALEGEVMQLWTINEQLSEQFKQVSRLNVQLTEYMKALSLAVAQTTQMAKNIEFRTTVLETKNEKAIRRPIG